MKKITNNIWIFLLSFLLTNCAVQKASVEADSKAKQLVAPEGKAIVYIMRPGTLGFAVKFKVNCDEKYIGATGGKRFIYTIQDVGKHKIVSYAENNEELEITFEANNTYYIEQIPKMGIMMARNKLSILSVKEGKEKLSGCKLSKDCIEK